MCVCTPTQILGSDLLVFGNPEHPAVSLHLQDTDVPMRRSEVLDLYLDNTLASVPEVAFCFHQSGTVRGYRIVPTSELPSMAPDDASFRCEASSKLLIASTLTHSHSLVVVVAPVPTSWSRMPLPCSSFCRRTV